MTTTVTATINHLLPTLLGVLIKGTLLLLLAALACRLLGRSSAATRHMVWTAALIGVLFLPLLSAFLPRWNVAWSRAAVSSPTAPPAAPDLIRAASASRPPSYPIDVVKAPPSSAAAPQTAGPSSAVVTAGPSFGEAAVHGDTPSPAPIRRIHAPSVCAVAGLTLWLVGTLASLARLAVGLRRIGRLGRRAVPLEGETLQVAEAAHHQIGLRHPVQFLRADDGAALAVPVTWGVLHPVVLLPAQSGGWSEECLRTALLHEMAHVQRRDWPTQLLAHLACTLCWWHPLVWWAARQAREESERACDDCVLSAGVKPTDYAQRLVEVVRSMPTGVPARTVAVAMAQPSEVEGRLRAVLALGSSRRPLTRQRAVGNCAISLLLVLPLAALRLTPSAQARGVSQGDATSAVRAASPSLGGAEAGVPPETADTGTTADGTADGRVTIVNGDRAVFPSGYEVSLVAVTQAVRTGNEWDMFGGPWWRPDGTPIAPQTGGLDGHWHWSVEHTHGLPPFTFKVAFRTPRSAWRHGESISPGFFEQFLGALKPSENASEVHVVTSGPYPTVRDINSPLADDSAPQRFGGAVGGTRCAEIYPTGTRTCTVRCGLAVGPWQTVARHPFALTPASVTTEGFVPSPWSSTARDLTDVSLALDDRPRETYLDARGKRHVFFFLGAAGRLGNVARRFVAVDRAGRVIPLNEFGAQRAALAFGSQSDVTRWNPTLDLARVKEFRLQTCPYLTAEFRSVQLQPALAAGGAQDAATALLAQAGAEQLEQARVLRAHLQGWAESNRAPLQRMACAQPDDLAALMAVYDSLQRLPFPLWDGDPRLSRGNEDAQFTIGLPSRLTLTHLQRSQELGETRMRRDFAQFRDLVVTESQEVGGAHLTLWASGRITRTTARDQFMGHGKLLRTAGSEQEVMPAFFGDNGASGTGGVVAHATADAAKSLPVPTAVPDADSAEGRQAQKAIRAAYATGFGRMGIMNVPQAWHPDRRSYRTALHLLGLTVSGGHAMGTTRQEDSVTLTDPATGQSHQATAEAVFEGSWDKTPRGWNARWFRPLSIVDKIDGRRVTQSDGKFKSYDVAPRVWPPLPPSYPYWK